MCDAGSATFTPDGSQLVVTTNDGPAVHVWDLRKIRKHLDGMGLDWDAPAYSDLGSAGPSSPRLPPPMIDFGPLAEHVEDYAAPAAELLKRYTERIAKNSNDADAYHHRAHALGNLIRFPEGMDDMTRAIRLRPGDGHYRAYRAAFYDAERQYDLAIVDLEAALTLKVEEYPVQIWLAEVCKLRLWQLVVSTSRPEKENEP